MTEEQNWRALFNSLRDEDWDSAIDMVDSLIKKEPEDPTHYIKLGDFYLQKNNSEGAARAFQKAGDLYLAEGVLAKAICAYKKVSQIKPYDLSIQKKITECMMELKEKRIPEKTEVCRVEAKGESKEEVLRNLVSADCLPRPFRENQQIMGLLKEAALLNRDEGEIIIREGEKSRSVFLILRGTVSVITEIGGNDLVIARLGPGDIFGEMAFITGHPRTATVISGSSDLRVLEVGYELLERMIELEPSILKYLYDIYKARKAE